MALRIVVVGDELVAGVGDPKALGWVGRVVARTIAPEPPMVLPLAMPAETSTQLAARWETEVLPRLDPASDNRLVVALGRHDNAAGLSLARSRLNLAKILDAASQRQIPSFVVGPPPGPPEANMHLAALSAAFLDVTDRRAIPYVETFAPLVAHDQWLADLASSDGVLPGQAGYGLIAWLVLHTGWHSWLGLPSDAD
ncbi:MAG: GDSL-type esterase/lipase family protein [Micrococcales bacterium]|nr:GDSL-type esterase/lipase family protein [Micrococcales bacterium]